MFSMKWRLEGNLVTGIPAVVEWDGSLTASAEALAAINEIVQSDRGAWVTPTGPVLKADKSDELSCYVLGSNVIVGATVYGETPELPSADVPDGAIA